MLEVRVIKNKKKNTDLLDQLEKEPKVKGVRHNKTNSMTDEIAESSFCYLNFTVSQLKDYFPQNRDLFHVDKYYPYAKGGPLFIDTPRFVPEIDLCELKKVAMKELKLRYLAITPQMDLGDCLLELHSK